MFDFRKPVSRVHAILLPTTPHQAHSDALARPVENRPFIVAAIGDYRIELFDHTTNALVYAAKGIGGGPLSHLVPRLRADFISDMDMGASLAELPTGKTYRITVLVRSLAPAGSAGRGAEYNVRYPAQYWFFRVLADGSISNLQKGHP